ncbi:hypothetical protein CNMCM8927_000446 [Aspergillus lentulus]|uniref:Uncharacterized protein n=1 Tax=Aspergillus lentulus TaxID=293939 RepID=A0AAN5YVG6_ASPLE|nr:hypothetical protein CNMCM6069_007331 [Aspergillus lentulus]KAF4176592.1 hypothetical protein CNMCM7927_004026 [Aspergillus lentulus]KAF4208450.1 hypothetical protein CNMCM8927_000446 [Aspergillus lentulus]
MDMDDTYFPDELWLNREVLFASPSTSAWKLTIKLKESIRRLSQKESEEYQTTSISIAMFECHRSSDPTQQARVLIYTQIPNKGTQALPPDMRRRQASGEGPDGLQEELEAYERLANHEIDFTPQLVGFKHERQDVNGLVPDGFVTYTAYTKVPGVALGTRIYRFGDGSDIPDVSVASAAPSTRQPGRRITQYSIPEGLFWTMRRSERDLIRDKFNEIYRKLLAARVKVEIPYLDNLFWEQKTQELSVFTLTLSTADDNLILHYGSSYIDGVFVPTDGTVTWRPQDVALWGLAVFPGRHNLGLQDENDTDFVAAGWIL